MAPSISAVAGSDRSAQAALARDLVQCMGRESAIQVCRSNGWIGVLEILTGQGQSSEDREG